MEEQQFLKKPAKIDRAVKIIFGTIILQILITLVWNAVLVLSSEQDIAPALSITFGILIFEAVPLFLAVKISQGKKWARALFAFLMGVGLLAEFCPDPVATDMEPRFEQISAILNIVGYVLFAAQFYAVYLLFHHESNEYFTISDGEKLDKMTSASVSMPTETRTEKGKAHISGNIIAFMIIGALASLVLPGFVLAARLSTCGVERSYSGLLCLTPFMFGAALGGAGAGFVGKWIQETLKKRSSRLNARIIGNLSGSVLAIGMGIAISVIPAGMMALPDC